MPAPEQAQPAIPCVAGQHELIIDPKLMCSIPYDANNDGVKSFRAFVVPKGKCVHHPHQPGRYVVFGTMTEAVAPCLVHFAASTLRKPELVLSFVDYGFSSSSLEGISVETLPLPLMIKANTYQKHASVTAMERVAGFSPLPDGAPYSIQLAPTLRVNAPYRLLNIENAAGVSLLMKKPLEDQLQRLETIARTLMDKECSETAKSGDQRGANKARAGQEAHMKFLMSKLQLLPPSAYDVPVDERFLTLEQRPDQEEAPAFMTSPLRQQLHDGGAMLLRTRLVPAAPKNSAEAGRSTSPIAAARDEQEDAPGTARSSPSSLELSDDDDDDDERLQNWRRGSASKVSHGDRLADDDSPERGQQNKRQRKQTDLYQPPAAGQSNKAAGKAPAAAPKPSQVEKAAEKATKIQQQQIHAGLGLKPDGKPYIRGPYKKGDKSLPKVAAAAAQREHLAPSAAPGAAAADASEISRLKASLLEFGTTIAQLRAEVAEKDAAIAMAVKEAVVAVHQEYVQKMEDKFMQGVACASRIANGGVFTWQPTNTPASASATPSATTSA